MTSAVSSAPNPEFMRRAIALATENVRTSLGGPFGAVIVRDGLVVGEGANSVTRTNDPTAHAEVQAIRDACRALGVFSLEGCTIYTSCEPCPMCLAAIYWARIDRIWYGNTSQDAARIAFDDAALYREFTLPPAQRSIPSSPLLREQAWESFQAWLDSSAKTPY
jgi:tRNA(Arg) A34 adenosine deaminase TadA